MKNLLHLPVLAIFALTSVATNAVRADKITFSWQTSFTPNSITPGQQTQGSRIDFASMSGQGTFDVGTSPYQYAVGTAYQPPYFPSKLAMYDYTPFVMTLKLTDGPSGLSDNLKFHGTVAGGILFDPPPMMAGAEASFAFTDGFRSVTIGQDVYHIAMQIGTIEGGRNPPPNIFAQIDVAHVSNTPEPSSLVLAGFGLLVLLFAGGTVCFRARNRIGLVQSSL